MSVDWKPFAKVVRAHQRFLLTSHIRPDCDALGSELAMAGVLESMGKEVLIINGHPTPPNLAFIDPERRIKVINEDVQLADLINTEVLIVLDTSAWAQLGPMGEVLRTIKAKKIVVDHHVGEDDLGAEFFKDTTAEAAGRLVIEAADYLDVAITPPIARAAFAAVATDTGWFRFGSTSSGTYALAAKLAAAGANPAEIYGDLYERDTLGRVRLRGLILSRTQSELDGQLVHTFVKKDDFSACGALPSDTEDVVNMTLAIAGTKVAVILVEQATGGFKISFRSRCHVDCNQLASQFGGGGHKAAAGAFVAGNFDEAQSAVLNAARTALSG
ncbi:MAG: DHHA1 domain-containing protein [Pirellulaceae bacterium]|nr:DHH family phosphoesterase [Planctomycetales bacterium]